MSQPHSRETRELPPEAADAIRRIINRLADEQDWAGPSAAYVEGRWKDVLTEAYWLYRDGMLPGREVVPVEDVIERIFPGLPTGRHPALKP